MSAGPGSLARLLVTVLALAGVAACQQPVVAVNKAPRRVQVVAVALNDYVETAALTGEVQARTWIDLAFRTTGQIGELAVAVGDHVTANQVLARIDADLQRADLELADAGVQAAEAALEQSVATLARQQALLAGGLSTRSKYDQAEQDQRTAESTLKSAQVARQAALNALSHTELRAGADGIVTRINRTLGEIAPAALPVISVAYDGPRDAVFNVHEPLLFADPDELRAATVDIALLADPGVRTTGAIRELSPTVDPRSGTVRVRVAMRDTPAAMTLGALVTGRVTLPAVPAIVIPWSAITIENGRPAVWLVDPQAQAAFSRPIEIEKYTTGGVVVARGLRVGDLLAVEGGQFLYEGKSVSVVRGDPA